MTLPKANYVDRLLQNIERQRNLLRSATGLDRTDAQGDLESTKALYSLFQAGNYNDLIQDYYAQKPNPVPALLLGSSIVNVSSLKRYLEGYKIPSHIFQAYGFKGNASKALSLLPKQQSEWYTFLLNIDQKYYDPCWQVYDQSWPENGVKIKAYERRPYVLRDWQHLDPLGK